MLKVCPLHLHILDSIRKKVYLSSYSSKHMALSRLFLFVAILLLLCTIQVSSDSDIKIEGSDTQVVRGANRRLMAYLDCGGLCKTRCSKHSRPKVCIRACGTCCMRCKCVPPGTSGNREVCGKCYTDMTTHGNKPKCP